MDVDLWSMYIDGRTDSVGWKGGYVVVGIYCARWIMSHIVMGNFLRPVHIEPYDHEEFVASAV